MEWKKNKLDRHHLLSFNIERIEQAYVQAISKGMANPVILVVDASDRIGKAIITAHVGETAWQEWIGKVKDAIPTFLLAFELEVARKNLGLTAPAASQTLSQPLPDGTFWVVAVANGGNTYAALRKPN